MSKNLAIIFYEPIDYISFFINETIECFPLFKYKYDLNDKRDNYYDMLTKHIQTTKPQFILWFFCDISTCEKVRTDFPDIKNIAIIYRSTFNRDLFACLRLMNYVFTDDVDEIERHTILLETDNVFGFIQPFDERLDYLKQCKKKHNIVVYLTSPDSFDEEKILQINLYGINNDMTVELYGYDYLERIFPNIYKSNPDQLDLSIIIAEADKFFYLDDPNKPFYNENTVIALMCKTQLYVKHVSIDNYLEGKCVELSDPEWDKKKIYPDTTQFKTWNETVAQIYDMIKKKLD